MRRSSISDGIWGFTAQSILWDNRNSARKNLPKEDMKAETVLKKIKSKLPSGDFDGDIPCHLVGMAAET